MILEAYRDLNLGSSAVISCELTVFSLKAKHFLIGLIHEFELNGSRLDEVSRLVG